MPRFQTPPTAGRFGHGPNSWPAPGNSGAAGRGTRRLAGRSPARLRNLLSRLNRLLQLGDFSRGDIFRD
jgi:hypothetical protein